MREIVRTPRVLTTDEIKLTDLYLEIRFRVYELELRPLDVVGIHAALGEIDELLETGEIDQHLRSEMKTRTDALAQAFLLNRMLMSLLLDVEKKTETGALVKPDVDSVLKQLAACSYMGLSNEKSVPIFLRLERCLKISALSHVEFQLAIGTLRMRGIVPYR